MFSISKKGSNATRKNNNSVGLGIFDTPDDLDLNNDDIDDGDSDFEKELAALASGSPKKIKRTRPKPKTNDIDLDRMVADSLKDINTDDEDDDDGDGDPDLLNELSEIAGSSSETDLMKNDDPEPVENSANNNSMEALIKSRIDMYNLAITNAKQSNDSRARRFERGLKTLNGMLKQVNSGKQIDISEVPPEIVVKPLEPNSSNDNAVLLPSRPAPQPPKAESSSTPEVFQPTTKPDDLQPKPSIEENNKQDIIKILLDRQREYKLAALDAKKSNDLTKAKSFVKILKLFDAVIKAAQDGQAVDLSDMPPPPHELPPERFAADTETNIENNPPPKEEAENQQSAEKVIEDTAPSKPVTPSSMLEALTERLNVYKNVEKTAKEENNNSKARRFGRIVKQYEDAIKLFKAGKPVPYDELPSPPGYGPLITAGPAVNDTNATAAIIQPVPNLPSPPVDDDKKKKQSNDAIGTPAQVTRPSSSQDSSGRLSGNHSNTNLMNKTIATITQRQKEFREAAVLAKKANEIDEAKEYLRIYKGLENLLDTARGGLPIDLSSLPIPPSQRTNLEDSFTIVSERDCVTDDISDIGARIEEQLQKQLTMCKNTRDHNRAMGDVAGTNRFENLALTVQKDYDLVKIARRNNLPLPKFHYEQKQFNIVKCNTDLTENELQINVVRGIGYVVANPKDVDTYVKVEFPYPQETPFKARTQTIRDTDSPEYNEKFTVEINSKLRPCQRVFKRHSLKLEVYSKGCGWRLEQCCESLCCFSGFLRSDVLIGTAQIKLQPLETTCEIHDSFNLMDGRKVVGGKLEIKIRTRNPILTKQIEHIKEKWIVIDT